MRSRGGTDYDWVVIGSGFGGSVSALRLAEKGYSVGVIECGRRFEDKDFAEDTSQARRYYWMPKLGMRGILRLTLFKDIFIASGCGVGGGSLGFANTLYRARPSFYETGPWGGHGNWSEELRPHYDTAERMLGVETYDRVGPADELIRDLGEHLGVAETFKPTRVGVLLGDEPGKLVGDPYFDGEGPDRKTCVRCGSCMVGCRHGAKNTLMKNYLWFAEKLGARIVPDRMVTDIRPVSAEDGSGGYEITHQRAGAWFRKQRRTVRAHGVVLAAGALGTNLLLANCKASGSLGRVSERLGHLVRTNSESVLAVTAPNDDRDFAASVAITSSIYPDPNTHIEPVTYGRHANSMRYLQTLLTGEGTRLTRPLIWAGTVVRHPINFLRTLSPANWSKRTVILLVMQSLDNAIRFVPKSKLFGGGVKLQTEQDPEKPNPTFIPVANEAAEWIAKQTGGYAQSQYTEAILNTPVTAHILGGAVVAPDPESGVIDTSHQVFGYENLLVCDGAAIPANPGVNPSLTITAMAERAMSMVPPREGAELGHLPEPARAAEPAGLAP